MSRVSFHESLEQIEMNLLSMGELAGTSVQRSVEALVQHDDANAETVTDDDDTVDELYLKIRQRRAVGPGAAVSRSRRVSR